MSLSFALWREITLARDPALMPGLRVVEVAPAGRAGTARRSTPGVAGVYSVPQRAAGLVAEFSPGMVTRAADDRGELDIQRTEDLRRTEILGYQRAAGPGARPGGAATDSGGSVRAQRSDTPAGPRAAKYGGDQSADVGGVQQAEPGGLPRCIGLPKHGGQRHGEVDQRCHARPVVLASTAPEAVAVGSVRPTGTAVTVVRTFRIVVLPSLGI